MLSNAVTVFSHTITFLYTFSCDEFCLLPVLFDRSLYFDLLKKTFLVYKERAFVFTTIWRLLDKYRRVKLKVSAILSLK